MDRVFLDANVIYSAARSATSQIRRLWTLDGVVLVTSAYAVMEAVVNLREDEGETAVEEAERLLSDGVEVLEIGGSAPLLSGGHVYLPAKDWPILSGAVEAGCTHLITGEVRHFGHLFDLGYMGVTVIKPGEYLLLRQDTQHG